MKKIEVCAYPYATQIGTIQVPDEITNISDYIKEHWNDIKFKKPELDYCGTDFEYYE